MSKPDPQSERNRRVPEYLPAEAPVLNYKHAHGVACVELAKAKAEIERLRHEEMRLRTALDYHVNELREARREIDRLRGAA